MGNVGQIETKYMTSGEAVTNLSLAVNEKWKDKAGETQEHTEWVRASMFGKLAEIAEKYVKKGDPLYISGSMKTRKWTDKEGVEKYTTEIRVKEMQMLGGKSEKPTPQNQPVPTQKGSGFDDLENDIPW